jgi:hypothetical protein
MVPESAAQRTRDGDVATDGASLGGFVHNGDCAFDVGGTEGHALRVRRKGSGSSKRLGIISLTGT